MAAMESKSEVGKVVEFVRAGPPAAAAGEPSTLQQWISELIGRDEELRQVLELVTRNRLVSLCGPGGIGKTRLAVEAARRLLERSAGKVCIAKLAPLSDPRLVPATVANALGLALAGGPVMKVLVNVTI